MSMEINNSYNDYRTNVSERLRTGQEKSAEAEKKQGTEKMSDKAPVLQDEYVSSEKSDVRHSGLYRLGQDEKGKPKVFFDEPKKNDGADGDELPKAKPDYPEKISEKCTTNSDKVDREIEKLKRQEQQLERQIEMASGDEKKEKELEKKLSRIKSELSRKDNDTYRRQNASVSE